MLSHCGFDLISLVTDDVEHHFMCLWPFVYFFGEMSIQVLWIFCFSIKFFFCLFLLWSCTCLHISDTRSNHIWFAHIFHIHRLSFTFLRMFFDAYRILLWWSPVYVFLVACAFGLVILEQIIILCVWLLLLWVIFGVLSNWNLHRKNWNQ